VRLARLADGADRVLGALKWPVAVVSLAFLAPLALALVDVLRAIAHAPRHATPFLLGAAVYFAAWAVVFRRPIAGSLFSTAEHELTHAIFAWATFHRVVRFRATWRSGGHIEYLGRGNWLIAVAPYFFPTLSIAALVVLAFLPPSYAFWGSAGLGVTVAYHVTSTFRETHPGQPDLAKVGFPFAFAFLGAANALTYGVLLAFASGGTRALGGYFTRVGAHTTELLAALGAGLR
jgi:Peptidase M50B-like